MAQQKNDVAAPSTEVAVPASEPQSMAEVQAKLAAFTTAPMVYSTFVADDVESQKRLAMAVTDAEPLRDHLKETFNLTNFVVQATTMIDENGVEKDILRIILVSADGKAYSASSDGMFKVLQTYTGIFGHPSVWPAEGIAVQGVEAMGRRGRKYLTLKLV